VFVLIALVGILTILLMVTASVAYLALPRGRLCPHCGGMTNPVVLRRLLKVLSPWVQWRWCSRCAWEGPRHRGAGPGSAGSARRSQVRISLGRSGLRGCPDILLAVGRSG